MFIQIAVGLSLLWAGRAIPFIAERAGDGAAPVEFGFAAVYLAAFLILYATGGTNRPPFGAFAAKSAALSVLAGAGLFIVGMIAYTASAALYSKMGWGAPRALAFFDVKGPTETGALIAFITATVILEEYIFRGVILPLAAQHSTAIVAVLISALCFSLYHLSGFQFAATFLWGLGLGAIYLSTQSLISPIIAHLTFNLLSVAMFVMGAIPKAPA